MRNPTTKHLQLTHTHEHSIFDPHYHPEAVEKMMHHKRGGKYGTGIGRRSYAQMAVGDGLDLDVREVAPGHYKASIQTHGKSIARRALGPHFEAEVKKNGRRAYSAHLRTKPKGVGARGRRLVPAVRSEPWTPMEPRGVGQRRGSSRRRGRAAPAQAACASGCTYLGTDIYGNPICDCSGGRQLAVPAQGSRPQGGGQTVHPGAALGLCPDDFDGFMGCCTTFLSESFCYNRWKAKQQSQQKQPTTKRPKTRGSLAQRCPGGRFWHTGWKVWICLGKEEANGRVTVRTRGRKRLSRRGRAGIGGCRRVGIGGCKSSGSQRKAPIRSYPQRPCHGPMPMVPLGTPGGSCGCK